MVSADDLAAGRPTAATAAIAATPIARCIINLIIVPTVRTGVTIRAVIGPDPHPLPTTTDRGRPCPTGPRLFKRPSDLMRLRPVLKPPLPTGLQKDREWRFRATVRLCAASDRRTL